MNKKKSKQVKSVPLSYDEYFMHFHEKESAAVDCPNLNEKSPEKFKVLKDQHLLMFFYNNQIKTTTKAAKILS